MLQHICLFILVTPFLSLLCLSPSPYSPHGPAMLSCPVRLWPREWRWTRLQGGRHHHPDQQDRRELVRGHVARQLRLLPRQLCGYPGGATPLGRQVSVRRHDDRQCLQWQAKQFPASDPPLFLAFPVSTSWTFIPNHPYTVTTIMKIWLNIDWDQQTHGARANRA